MTSSADDGRPLHPWFIEGHAAFTRAFPKLAAIVDVSPFYVCPLCLQTFGADAWHDGYLSRDHVPPESLGGQRLVLTCRPCNNETGGSEVDHHMRREADFGDFLAGNMDQRPVDLVTDAGRVPIRMSVTDHGIAAFGVQKAVDPAVQERVLSRFDDATKEGGWEDFSMTFEFQPFSIERAATGWLRTAYLAFFAALGYRFVMRPELNEVRAKFQDPQNHPLKNFRVTTPTLTPEPRLLRINSPGALRSYALMFRSTIVFLPRYGDHGLYERLGAEGEHVNARLSGNEYPWPAGSERFTHDRLDPPNLAPRS